MKKLKTGFTLAEVLITLSIIGIIAAIVMPALISSYHYKTVGVKLSKMASTTEDSARAFVVQNDSFKTNEDVMSFVNESFLIKKLDGSQNDTLVTQMTGNSTKDAFPTYYTVSTTKLGQKNAIPDTHTQDTKTGLVGILKDNTTILIQMANAEEYTKHKGVVDSFKVGMPVFNINFDPKANGLPSTVQKNFNFIVTELGYVFPNDNDDCLWKIYEDDWNTNARTFTSGSACNKTSVKTETKTGN